MSIVITSAQGASVFGPYSSDAETLADVRTYLERQDFEVPPGATMDDMDEIFNDGDAADHIWWIQRFNAPGIAAHFGLED